MELVLKEKTWSEVEDTLKKMLLESVIALMAFHKYPVPNESTLVKRVKVCKTVYEHAATFSLTFKRTSTLQGGVRP